MLLCFRVAHEIPSLIFVLAIILQGCQLGSFECFKQESPRDSYSDLD